MIWGLQHKPEFDQIISAGIFICRWHSPHTVIGRYNCALKGVVLSQVAHTTCVNSRKGNRDMLCGEADLSPQRYRNSGRISDAGPAGWVRFHIAVILSSAWDD